MAEPTRSPTTDELLAGTHATGLQLVAIDMMQLRKGLIASGMLPELADHLQTWAERCVSTERYLRTIERRARG